jgi:hypothetical protein
MDGSSMTPDVKEEVEAGPAFSYEHPPALAMTAASLGSSIPLNPINIGLLVASNCAVQALGTRNSTRFKT